MASPPRENLIQSDPVQALSSTTHPRVPDRGVCAVAAILAMLALLSGCQHYQPVPLAPEKTAAELDARSLGDSGLRTFLEGHLRRSFPTWPPASWDFETLTLVAFYYHPGLDLARAQWRTARSGIETAGGRPNPSVGVTPGYSFNPPSGTSPWFPLLSIDWPFETAGKRGFRLTRAGQLADAARWNLVSTAWQVRSNLRRHLLDHAAARQRAELLQQQLRLEQQTVTLLEERLRAGAIASYELTPPRLALAKTGLDFADAQRQTVESRVRIADALGLSVKAIAGAEFDASRLLTGEAEAELTPAEARQRALSSRPDILAALAEYAASQSALQLEVARQYPDLHLGTGYQFDQGEHKWSLGATAEIPVLNQNQGPISEARARREESAARFVSLQARVIAEIDSALAVRATAAEQLARQTEFARLTRSQASSVQALFQAGAADQLDVCTADLAAQAGDLASLEARIRVAQAAAQLEDALQQPLDHWPDLESGRTAPSNSTSP